MFSLFRDSIFRPKRIIDYRRKPAWFVVLYVSILIIFGGICALIPKVSYSEISQTDKILVVNKFKGTGASLTDYVYQSDSMITIDIEGYTIAFLDASTDATNLNITADLIVYNGYLYASGVFYKTFTKLISLKDVSSKFENVDLSNMTIDSPFFDGINEFISRFRVTYLLLCFGIGAINQIGILFVFTLMSFVFCLIFYKAGDFIKKSQLFKMLLFAYTLTLVVEGIVMAVGISGTLIEYLLVGLSIIPSIILEREISIRIKVYQFNNGLLNDPYVKQKIQDFIDQQKKKDEENKDE